MTLALLKVVFVHPENHSYPIFTVELNHLGFTYVKKRDHDEIRI